MAIWILIAIEGSSLGLIVNPITNWIIEAIGTAKGIIVAMAIIIRILLVVIIAKLIITCWSKCLLLY